MNCSRVRVKVFFNYLACSREELSTLHNVENESYVELDHSYSRKKNESSCTNLMVLNGMGKGAQSAQEYISVLEKVEA